MASSGYINTHSPTHQPQSKFSLGGIMNHIGKSVDGILRDSGLRGRKSQHFVDGIFKKIDQNMGVPKTGLKVPFFSSGGNKTDAKAEMDEATIRRDFVKHFEYYRELFRKRGYHIIVFKSGKVHDGIEVHNAVRGRKSSEENQENLISGHFGNIFEFVSNSRNRYVDLRFSEIFGKVKNESVLREIVNDAVENKNSYLHSLAQQYNVSISVVFYPGARKGVFRIERNLAQDTYQNPVAFVSGTQATEIPTQEAIPFTYDSTTLKQEMGELKEMVLGKNAPAFTINIDSDSEFGKVIKEIAQQDFERLLPTIQELIIIPGVTIVDAAFRDDGSMFIRFQKDIQETQTESDISDLVHTFGELEKVPRYIQLSSTFSEYQKIIDIIHNSLGGLQEIMAQINTLFVGLSPDIRFYDYRIIDGDIYLYTRDESDKLITTFENILDNLRFHIRIKGTSGQSGRYIVGSDIILPTTSIDYNTYVSWFFQVVIERDVVSYTDIHKSTLISMKRVYDAWQEKISIELREKGYTFSIDIVEGLPVVEIIPQDQPTQLPDGFHNLLSSHGKVHLQQAAE